VNGKLENGKWKMPARRSFSGGGESGKKPFAPGVMGRLRV
jgi:hypothetical protein